MFKSLFVTDFVKFNTYRRLLENHLRIRLTNATKIVDQNPQIYHLSEEYLIEHCQYCTKLNIDVSRLHKDADILFSSKYDLENKVMLLLDMGAPRDQSIILHRFKSSMELRMRVFKSYMKIPKEEVVANNFLSLMKTLPKDVQPLEIPSDNWRVIDYYNHCLKWYIQWKLNVPKENVKEMKNISFALRRRSFSIMEQLFDIYRNEIGLTIEEIIEHRCLANSSPNNLRLIIDENKIFDGKVMKKLIKRTPKLCTMEYRNVVTVVKLLEKHDYAEIAIQRYPEILLIGASELAYKFKQVDDTPELRVLKNNVLSMGLVLHQYNKSQLRLSYLRYLNIKYASVRILTSNDDSFEMFLATGSDRSRALEIRRSFTKIFNATYRKFMPRLQKHPYWNLIDLVSMHDTTNFLLKENFTTEEIYENLQIILYPREKIEVILDDMKNEFESLSECSEDRKKPWTKQQKLAFCLYKMELEFHFSGDGVWPRESLIPRQVKPPIRMIEIPDNELSDCSDMENDENEEIDQIL